MYFSVILPVYNSEKTIINTLISIKNQTIVNTIGEIIIVNDGSTDKTQEVINEFIEGNKSLNIILINKENGGVSTARNVGLKIAQYDLIALIDSDDEWLPNKLELQLDVFKKNLDVDFLGGNYNGKELNIGFKKIRSLYKASITDLCIKFFPVTPSAVFKRNIIEELGLFDEKRRYAEDGQYFMRICSKYNYYHLPVQMVICGAGKPEFGYSGLSSNLKGMYVGNVENIKELFVNRKITKRFYLNLRMYYWLKYIRRIIITKKNKLIRRKG
ncbi:glycosyltransferase family 2 protein [Priestia megaterium]|uniref:glycosyltransferase family 2 protein n=1 Tax=Priestia megaterium TaxID=1404 RepID=UPI0020420A66|nr:glycosyltransferase family A protein [Priestia megaterium]MCM3150852.1 glycosyltransferase family 2 protein [Priestia megaterium]